MPEITFILPDGSEHGFEAPAGVSLMQAAAGAGVPGILADCGGALNCATCHVYVDETWWHRLPAPQADERALLDLTAAERRPTSRLSCQVRLTDALQGLVVHVPDSQQ
jgi:ferredoxin, 2Fe-2S